MSFISKFHNRRASRKRPTRRESRHVTNPGASIFLATFWTAARFRVLWLGDAPKSRCGHDKFDADLRLAHEAIASADDTAEQFFRVGGILNVDYLIHLHCSGQQYQRSVVIHDYGFRLFRHGSLVGTAEPDQDWDPDLDTFATPAILRAHVGRGHDGHE